ncbi:hypothetical protein ACFPYM_08255 [Methylobacterium hispanicum]
MTEQIRSWDEPATRGSS